MRKLTDGFMADLRNPDGLLHPILTRVQQDNTLMLAIRENYINIYYRGGNILRVKVQGDGTYTAFFDTKYQLPGTQCPILPETIQSSQAAGEWVKACQILKGIMDFYFTVKGKEEREFQQLVVRENNIASIAYATEYFITDIEYTDGVIKGRFDMTAIQWLGSHRKSTRHCRPVLMEMKYSDKSLSGNAGIIKHLEDIDELLSNQEQYDILLKTMEKQFNQLDRLGLLSFNKCENWQGMKLARNAKPEVVFLFANHNPRSKKLQKIMADPAIDAYLENTGYDLRFFVSSFAGYAMHSQNMLTLKEFRKLLEV